LCLTGDVLTFVAGFRLQQSGLGNTFPRVFDKSDGAGLVNGYGFYIDDGVGDDYRFDVNGASYGSDTLSGTDKYKYHIACVTKDGGTLTFFKEAGDQMDFGQVTATNAIPSATTNAAIGNWNHTTDRNWHGYIDFVYLWDRVLDLGARRELQNNPWQFVKPRLSGRTYVAYGITAPIPPRGDSGKGSIVIAITS
jgi:Concanavalin A-like lectin/glucanases superfamily